VPDYYQGTELWDFSLVDPDNRRPVDYELRRKALELLSGNFDVENSLKNLADGQAKLKIIKEGLKLRKDMPELFLEPTYMPLYADGGKEENICAFALSGGGKAVIAVAPRLFAGMVQGPQDAPMGDAWGDAALAVPAGIYEDRLTGERHDAREGRIALSRLLRRFPVALLATAG
jgi:(1->4)-alpha-D-glucan 1-alpha-D-glucosylmutase